MKTIKTMKTLAILSLLILIAIAAQSQNQNPTQNVCAGSTENYNVTTALTASTFAWTIVPVSGGTIVGTGNNVSITWSAIPGVYTVKVIETSANGCIGDPKTVAVTIIAPATAIAGTNQTICTLVGSSILLSGASVSNAASQTWISSGTGSFNDNTLVQPTYSITAADQTAGSITFTLTAAGNAPCSNAISTVIYTITTAPVLTIANNGAVCETNALNLTSSIPGATYSWTGPNAYTSTLQNPDVSANATLGMVGTYNLTVSSIPGGCPNLSASTLVVVNPKPTTSSIWHN